MRRTGAPLLALIRASHPLPALGVTAFTTVLAALAGNGAGRCALVAAAILCGQLTIGWTNDRHDLVADRIVGRISKPLAAGEVSPHIVDVATAVASVATIVLSLQLGWRAGWLHLGAVAIGWVYNFWLKGTWWSWLPYAVAFGALPAIATFALPAHPAPAAWAIAAGACLGTSANFANALNDVDDDRVTGFRGAPARIGGKASLLVSVVLAAVSCLVIAVAPPGDTDLLSTVCLGVGLAALVGAVVALWRRAETRAPFYALLGFVPIDLIMLADLGHLH